MEGERDRGLRGMEITLVTNCCRRIVMKVQSPLRTMLQNPPPPPQIQLR